MEDEASALNDEKSCCTWLTDCFGSVIGLAKAISILNLVKTIFSFVMYLYDQISDLIVGKEQIEKGKFWWGFWIIFLTFLPNLIFLVWYTIKRSRHLGKIETWKNMFLVGNVQLVTILNLICGVLLAFRPSGFSINDDITLNMDSTTGNVNFFRSIEGFAEALPQSVYQLSIMMRTEWTIISLNQKISLIISVVTVSMTASTYLFYQHLEYENFDNTQKRTYTGLNNPSIVNTFICTLLYVMLIAPRIWANSLTIAVCPKIALIMWSVELALTMLVSHKFASQYTSEFPGKIIAAIFNSICPCTPIGNIASENQSKQMNTINYNLAKINLASSLMILLKVSLLYPIVIYQHAVEYDNDPDRFRCWNKNGPIDHFNSSTAYDWNAKNPSKSIRLCDDNESPNQLLFQRVIPLTIAAICVFAIPSGYLISSLLRRSVLSLLQEKIEYVTSSVRVCFCACRNICCNKRIAKESTTNKLSVDLADSEDKILTSDFTEQPSTRVVSHENKRLSSNDNVPPQVKGTNNETMGALAFNAISLLINIRTIFEDLIKKDDDNHEEDQDHKSIRILDAADYYQKFAWWDHPRYFRKEFHEPFQRDIFCLIEVVWLEFHLPIPDIPSGNHQLSINVRLNKDEISESFSSQPAKLEVRLLDSLNQEKKDSGPLISSTSISSSQWSLMARNIEMNHFDLPNGCSAIRTCDFKSDSSISRDWVTIRLAPFSIEETRHVVLIWNDKQNQEWKRGFSWDRIEIHEFR